MRIARIVFVLGIALAAFTADAQVRLVVRSDGTKAIYNVGGTRHSSQNNLAWLAQQRNRPSSYDPIIHRYADEFNVDPVLIKAVIQVESDFNPSCVSNKGAKGLMQLMPATARQFGVEKIFDAEQNIRGGIAYLAYLLDLYGNNFEKVLAAYNAGEGAVAKYDGMPPYEETQTYVRRAMTVYYGRPYGTMSFGGAAAAGRRLKGGFRAATTPALTVASNRQSGGSAQGSTQILNVR